MEFFKGLGNKISNASQEVVKKTKDVADTMKLNDEISTENKKINNTYNMIGQKYFELYSVSPQEEFVELIASIKSSMNKIEELKEELRKIGGKKLCAQCNTEIDGKSPFCPMCGAKLPEEVEEVNVEIVETKNSCKNCGKTLEDGAVFCQSCGTKSE
jgi:rubrerythrin